MDNDVLRYASTMAFEGLDHGTHVTQHDRASFKPAPEEMASALEARVAATSSRCSCS